jgi:hypothetical protein
LGSSVLSTYSVIYSLINNHLQHSYSPAAGCPIPKIKPPHHTNPSLTDEKSQKEEDKRRTSLNKIFVLKKKFSR